LPEGNESVLVLYGSRETRPNPSSPVLLDAATRKGITEPRIVIPHQGVGLRMLLRPDRVVGGAFRQVTSEWDLPALVIVSRGMLGLLPHLLGPSVSDENLEQGLRDLLLPEGLGTFRPELIVVDL
jgi:hypothetical protein